jgi:hypothetical protein
MPLLFAARRTPFSQPSLGKSVYYYLVKPCFLSKKSQISLQKPLIQNKLEGRDRYGPRNTRNTRKRSGGVG